VAENNQIFKDRYSACVPGSSYHDLVCGHHIQSKYSAASCGTNCKKDQSGENIQNDEENQGESQEVQNGRRGKPFICGDYLVEAVRLRMLIEGIALSNEDDLMDDERQVHEQKIRATVETEINKLVKQRHRMCAVTKKFDDPKLQFFDQFLKEDGFKGIDDVLEESVAPRQPDARKLRKARKAPKRDTETAWLLRDPVKHVEEDEVEKDVFEEAQGAGNGRPAQSALACRWKTMQPRQFGRAWGLLSFSMREYEQISKLRMTAV
jgi:hypothetical protein